MLTGRKHLICLDCAEVITMWRGMPLETRCEPCRERYAVQLFLLREYLNQSARYS